MGEPWGWSGANVLPAVVVGRRRRAADAIVRPRNTRARNGMSNFSAMQQLAEQVSKVARVYQRNMESIVAMGWFAEQMSALNAVLLKSFSVDAASLNSAFELSKRISDIVSPIIQKQRAQFSEVARVLQDITQGYAAPIREVAAQMATVNTIIYQSLDWGIFDRLREVAQVKESIDAFTAAGWPIAPSMSPQLVARVVTLYREKRVRYASRVIISFYHRRNFERLNQMVENWAANPLFAPRMHILKDALEAHRQGKYTLSVPALFPQIEGILNDYVVTNGLVAKLGKIREVYNSAIGDPNDYDLIRWTIVATLLYQLQNNVYAFTDFEQELRRSINRRQVTRHTVLHGIALKYDRPIYSLKSFVLLDALSALQTP